MYLVDGITKQKGAISEDFETVIWLYIFFVEYIFQSKITVEKNWKFFLVIILFVVLALLFWNFVDYCGIKQMSTCDMLHLPFPAPWRTWTLVKEEKGQRC